MKEVLFKHTAERDSPVEADLLDQIIEGFAVVPRHNHLLYAVEWPANKRRCASEVVTCMIQC